MPSATAESKSAVVLSGIEVRGGAEFITRTTEALSLLCGSSFFEQVRPYLAVIEQAPFSGMAANRPRPTFLVGERTWRAPVEWYAGGILHDGYHSKLYHESRRRFLWLRFTWPSAWLGEEAERRCLEFQAWFLREIEADEAVQEYVRGLMNKPTYQKVRHRDW